jgi:hypothetical protein
MKKIITLLLAVAMSFATATAAFAETQAERKARKLAEKKAARQATGQSGGAPAQSGKPYVKKSKTSTSITTTTIDIAQLPLGSQPPGWRDDGVPRVNPNWVRDNLGFLRVVSKGVPGLLVLPDQLTDATLTASFKKTADPETFFGIIARYQNPRNYYAARFSADNRLSIVRVENGREETLAILATLDRIRENQLWTLGFGATDNIFTAIVRDDHGIEQARLDWMVETDFPEAGSVGLNCSTYAATNKLTLTADSAIAIPSTPPALAAPLSTVLSPIPLAQISSHNTPHDKLATRYDVIVAGAGTAGWAAAIQAARLGASVLLLEESDWIGGQMSAAAVTTMDEQGCWDKFPVRERGLYKEFHESITNYYYTYDKDPYRAYYSWPIQQEGGYEPKVTRATLYAFIANERAQGRTLDLATDTTVTAVAKTGDRITGVTIANGATRKEQDIACKVLVEATEYGDILPLAQVPYRLGISKSDNLDPEGPVQSHTWLAVIREYPRGLPAHLRISEPPPGYNPNRYKKTQLYGRLIWGAPGKDYKGPRTYRVLLAWRGMADIDSPSTGLATENRHTQAGLNGGYQDYPVNVRAIEDIQARRDAERDGIYRTLSIVYYLQQLGLNWGLAEDEGYNTPCNRRMMAARNLRPDLLPLAQYLPTHPYVRECRRAIGLYTLKTADMGRFENAKHFHNSVAMGDYFMDIDHGKTAAFIEKDLDSQGPAREGGPFQIPFEVFIPKNTDGLVLAEKNISQSRIVNGATRLQPSTMLDGQAAGAIAAHAALNNIQPRAVNPIAVQASLLAARANLIQRWHEDVPHGSPLWWATQLLSLHKVIDLPAPFNKTHDRAIGHGNQFEPAAPLTSSLLNPALARLAQLSGRKPIKNFPAPTCTWATLAPVLSQLDPDWRNTAGITPDAATPVTRADFALVAATILRNTARPALLLD